MLNFTESCLERKVQGKVYFTFVKLCENVLKLLFLFKSLKNSHKRVFLIEKSKIINQIHFRLAKKIDTSETTINLEELIPGVTYELVVKAGNSNGTSQLTPPLKFITADKYIIEAKGKDSDRTILIGKAYK